MKTIGETIGSFAITGIKPGESSPNNRKLITNKNFNDKWKIVIFYPNNFAMVFPDELNTLDTMYESFQERNAVVLIGSDEQDFARTAWQLMNKNNTTISVWLFSDNTQANLSIAANFGLTKEDTESNRIIFIVDPSDTVRHVAVSSLNLGNSTFKLLAKLQSEQI